MIISYRHGFVLIKTVKTAGSAIEVSLSELCGDDDVLTPINPPVPPHRPRNFEAVGFYPHIPAQKILAAIGPEVWGTLQKVTAERNPWDKVVSFYFWQKKHYEMPDTFAEFMRKAVVGQTDPYRLPPAWDLYSLDGRSCIDRFIQYERLNTDLDNFCREVIGRPLPKLYEAKTGIRPSGTDYRDLYDDQTRKMVAIMYEREIELLGYQF